jgi:DNA polymerase-3 subunit delta'
VEQERATRVIKRLILQNRLPHAILLIGKTGIGKKAFARAMAKSLLCCNRLDGTEACGECSSCRKVDALSHPDLVIVSTEGNTIKIDQIRAVIEKTSYRTAKDRFRVIIIEEAEKLSDEASNALLKILEEPPEGNIFVLTSSQHYQLLPTIRSRCCHIALQPASYGELLATVREKAKHLPQEEAMFYVLLSGGSRVKLKELLTREEPYFPWRSLSSRIETIARIPMWQFFSEMGKWAEEYPKLEALLGDIKIWLTILIRKGVIEKDAGFYADDIDKYLDFFETIEEAEQALRRFNVNKTLLLEEIGLKIKDCFV